MLILFPYYQRGGTDVSMEELEELVQKRRLAASTTQTEMAEIRALEAEIALLDKQYRTAAENISEMEATLQEVLVAASEIEVPDPPPIPEPDPVPEPPRSINRGVEFSILGLATDRQDIAIVVDMSGSMTAHRNKVIGAINEVLDQMKPDNRFVIIGYRGGPTFDMYPRSGALVAADTANLSGARSFVSGMSRRFGGGTPTQSALMRAINSRPEAIILMSDGAPDDGNAAAIVRNITTINRGRAEIHTVAIGDYTDDRRLTLFLQSLAQSNRGDFVGRAR
ncbi:MAG: vWA domain-containing protein [Pseudomonadota bacterium]